MAENARRTTDSADVILVTRDSRLRNQVRRLRPKASRLRCLSPQRARDPGVEAHEVWLDLDAFADAAGDLPWACERRVYFCSHAPRSAKSLPPGPYIQKPCSASIIRSLWAGAERGTGAACKPHNLPAWALAYHELDLAVIAQRIVQGLPHSTGYFRAVLYRYDAACGLLIPHSEQGSGSGIPIGALQAAPNDLLRQVIQSRQPLEVPDLAQWQRAAGVALPLELRDACGAAYVVPLAEEDQLAGVLCLLERRSDATPLEAAELSAGLRFVARCLHHAQSFERAATEARRDSLTGLHNRRWLIEALDSEIRRCQRYGGPLSLISIDLDGLKEANDRFGHMVGDEFLRHAATTIRAGLRESDAAARVGGDEFAVLLPATDRDGAVHVAQRIREAMRSAPFELQREQMVIRASLGVAQWRSDFDVERLRRAADEAMYQAKKSGGDRICPDP